MADFCSICEPDYFDIDLTDIALDLEPGHSESILCEGCNIRSLYKDELGSHVLEILVVRKVISIIHQLRPRQKQERLPIVYAVTRVEEIR